MKNGRTNFETLIWGIQHIAENHGFMSLTENWEEDGQVAICGIGINVPTIMDLELLCEDVGIDEEYIYHGDFGIDVYIPSDWYETIAHDVFDGDCMWQRIS
jgi:hypothetical protein